MNAHTAHTTILVALEGMEGDAIRALSVGPRWNGWETPTVLVSDFLALLDKIDTTTHRTDADGITVRFYDDPETDTHFPTVAHADGATVDLSGSGMTFIRVSA